MKRNLNSGVLLHLLAISVICSSILVGSTWKAYAAQPEEQPQSAVDSSLKQQADQLNKDAITLAKKEDLKGALDKFNQALELYRRAGDHKGEANALTNIGIAYWTKLHDLAKALDNFQQALPLWRSIADPAKEATTLFCIGSIYMDLKDKQKSFDYYTQALPLLQKVEDHHREALTLRGIGSIYADLGNFQKALDYLQQALPLFRAEKDQVDQEANTLEFIGKIYAKLQGNCKEALNYYTQSLQIWRDLKEHTQEVDTLSLMGDCSATLGDYRAALQHYTNALSIYKDLKDKAQEAATLNDIGSFYGTIGDNQKALDYYKQALDIRQATGDLAGQAEVLSNIGQTYDLLDEENKAIESYNKAFSLWKTLNNDAEAAKNQYFMGAIYANSPSQLEKALSYLKQSLEFMQAHRGSWSNDAAITLARVYIDLGDRAQAKQYLNLAIQLGKELEHPWNKAILFLRIGLVYTRLDDYRVALEYFNQALGLYKSIQDHHGEAQTLAIIGSTYYEQYLYQLRDLYKSRQGSSDEVKLLKSTEFTDEPLAVLNKALDYYEQSIRVQEQILGHVKLEELKVLLSGGWKPIDVYAGVIGILMRLKQATQAFNYSERARACTFLDQLGNTRLDIHKGADVQLIRLEQDLNLDISNLRNKLREENSKPGPLDDKKIDSLKEQLTRKEKDYEDLLIRIKLSNPEYASLVSVAPLALPEVQKLLDKDITLLSYFLTETEALAFIITQDSFEAVELPINEKDLEAAIGEFRSFASEDVPLPTLKRLYAGLIAPLKPYLKTPMVGIIPHRTLNYLPFAALIDDGQHYFGDDYTLFYLPSASVLQFIQQKRKPDSGSAVVFAQSRPKNFPELRFADQEARKVAEVYNTEPLIGEAATESALRSLAGNYSVVHVAAHSEGEPEVTNHSKGEPEVTNPLFLRLILEPDANADGSLEVREVYGLDLQKTQLVVLSACGTQLGAHSRGDDITGLSRAFIYAGTPTVVASLWSVDDEATSTLMTAFHNHLKRGMGKAVALQAAQAETRANHPHPYYWSAFVLTGDPRKTTQ